MREEIRVQHNKMGSYASKAEVQQTTNIDVEQSFDIPKDVITGKITRQFQGGLLVLTMPKIVFSEAEAEAVTK